MSIKTWREEFYPVTADVIRSRDDEELIEASLLKWIGSTKANLKKHDHDYIPFMGPNNCALCTKYFHFLHCVGCPLNDMDRRCGSAGSAYDKAIRGNLTPLINALAKCLDKELK